ncbi:Hsp20/alpha crystallin family protein [Halomonas campisalis]|uniref:Hsp20/alpha crystallin family protein n=1 Tax=Billgrantia campisalis TaxID=74661 RepID=A0ABS9PAW2_9GAMM|nr:Hsp20/alpha crystallin family protein [Halomonas campisalis]MCG6658893.1 Hsp20/alpha crystallin family protein [Halomonas campisalis]MDR5864807.1 Hsp20/alpha crystallin family protein [Halomonas campisalis]
MNEVTKKESTQEVANRQRREDALLPPVDIYEEDNALHLVADLPGVTRESLSIEVDSGVMSIEGEVQLDMPEGITATYAEVRAQRFARRFTLSHEIDAEAIEARVDNGVLHLVLPKQDSHRSRRIEVKAA